MKGWYKVKKNNKFPIVKNHRKVVVAALLMPGAPSVMFRVDIYAKGWGKSYKSFEAALKDRPYIEYWH